MPGLFLSYERKDLEQADWIAGQFAAEGVTVWRDQERLYAGLNWPKALGEAIAANDALLLLWSGRAAKSTFVELEWCTAVALKKTVLPCLLDETPLPFMLAAFQGVPPAEIAADARRFFDALAAEAKSPDPSHTEEVVGQLAEIGDGKPEEVLQRAKVAFNQRNWIVQGPVYQAGRDIVIGTPSPRKTWLEKWQSWVAIAVGILGILTGVIALVRSYAPAPKGQETATSKSAVATVQDLAGTISDDGGDPLAKVEISVLLGGKLVASDTTRSLGQYRLSVNGAAEADVALVAQRDGYQTEKRYAKLGDLGFNFKMRRKTP